MVIRKIIILRPNYGIRSPGKGSWRYQFRFTKKVQNVGIFIKIRKVYN